eukprot:9915122-Prorocentrum_lima.AAC.1
MSPEKVGSEMALHILSPVAISFLLDEVQLRGSLLRRLGLPGDLISCFRLFNEQIELLHRIAPWLTPDVLADPTSSLFSRARDLGP